MTIVLATITKPQTFHDRNPIKRIASKFDFVQNLRFFNRIFHLIGAFSFSSSKNDHWNGFDSGFETQSQSYQSGLQTESSVNNAIAKKSHKSEKSSSHKTEKNDFDALDVKASKPTKSTNKTKSIEDDAWNLLNN